MKIAIVGGGNLGHAIAATASLEMADVCVLAANSAKWNKQINVRLPSNKTITSSEIKWCETPRDALVGADIVLLTVPSHVIAKTLARLKDCITPGQLVGSVVASGGFFWIARQVLGKDIELFAFQRVPFICRVMEKGQAVDIKGYKKELFVASSNINNNSDRLLTMQEFFSRCFSAQIKMLNSFLEATISNSNPILHTSRLYSLLNAEAISSPLYFYRDWDKEASQILLACDQEIALMLRRIGIPFPLFKSLKEHYEVKDPDELTRKLASIAAFSNITLPVVKSASGKVMLDKSSRYFQEDLPYGIVVLRALAEQAGVKTPNMDKIIDKLQGYISKEYLNRNRELKGRDIGATGIPQNFGFNTLEELIRL